MSFYDRLETTRTSLSLWFHLSSESEPVSKRKEIFVYWKLTNHHIVDWTGVSRMYLDNSLTDYEGDDWRRCFHSILRGSIGIATTTSTTNSDEKEAEEDTIEGDCGKRHLKMSLFTNYQGPSSFSRYPLRHVLRPAHYIQHTRPTNLTQKNPNQMPICIWKSTTGAIFSTGSPQIFEN